MEVWTVTEYIDRETTSPHGVFSTPEKARDAITQLAKNPRFRESGVIADAYGGAIWAIDRYTLDVIS